MLSFARGEVLYSKSTPLIAAPTAAASSSDPAPAAKPETEHGDSDVEAKGDGPMAVVDKASQVPMGTKDFLGWRTSYRLTEPEEPDRKAILKNIQWKAKFFLQPGLGFGEAARAARQRLEEYSETREVHRAAMDEHKHQGQY